MKLTTAFHKINSLTKKIKCVQGGQGAGKTYSILIKLITRSLTEKLKITIVTQTYPQLKDGAIADTADICNLIGVDFANNYNTTDKNLIIGNSIIQFRNVDNKDFHRLKGVRRDILFVNEANRTYWLAIEQMFTRSKETYLDYNPDMEFWAHEHIIKRDDCDFISLTYNDNECLAIEEIDEIEMRIAESKKPGASDGLKQWVRIYAYGELGTFTERQIVQYKFFKMCDLPATAKRIPSGMDFGMSPDPTCLNALWIDGPNLYANTVFSENNLEPEKLKGAERMSVVDKLEEVKHKKGWLIIGDSSGAREIADMRKHQYNVHAVKGKNQNGSQKEGLKILRGYNLFITPESKTLKTGCESWFFKVDRNGKIIPEPDGHEPDDIAAIRYVMMMKNNLWQ